MKKIISILLMLSMVFSLVACSTEPASDVVDNNNVDVSGEVSEEVTDNETDSKEDEFVPENKYHGTIWRTEKVLHSDTKEEYTNHYTEIDFYSASEAFADVARRVLYGENDEYIDAGSEPRFVYTIEEDGVLFDNGVITFKALFEGDYLVFDDGRAILYFANQTEQAKDDTKFFDESFYKLTWYSTSNFDHFNEEVVENSPFDNSILDFSEDGTVKWTMESSMNMGTWVSTGGSSVYEMEFDGQVYEVYQMGHGSNPRDPGTLVIDDTYYLDIERTLCELSETVWEISALEDKNGNRTDSPAPLTFEFTSETGGKFTQPEKIDNISLDKEIGGTLLNIGNLSGLTENLVLTGKFFEKYNNDGSDKAEVTITENEMIISTDVQNFVFDYSGVRATTVLQDMSLVLDEVYDERITVLREDGRTDLERFYVEENKLELFLSTDGTAELSNGAETLTGTWNYDDVLIGPDGGHINISSDIFDIESNPEFFADLLTELKNIDGQIEWSVDSSLDAYPGNVTYNIDDAEIWFDLGETRFSFVQDTDFNHFATIDNSFN